MTEFKHEFPECRIQISQLEDQNNIIASAQQEKNKILKEAIKNIITVAFKNVTDPEIKTFLELQEIEESSRFEEVGKQKLTGHNLLEATIKSSIEHYIVGRGPMAYGHYCQIPNEHPYAKMDETEFLEKFNIVKQAMEPLNLSLYFEKKKPSYILIGTSYYFEPKK